MLYRIRQGIAALLAWGRPLDLAAAREVLSPELMALFRRMRRSEQLHSLGVMRSAQAAGHTGSDLLVAALLHDVGKSQHPIGLAGRTLAVLAQAFAPGKAAQWAQAEPRGWRKSFVVAARHPEWSAELLAQAGASAMAVALVRRHAENLSPDEISSEEDHLLAALQAADAAN